MRASDTSEVIFQRLPRAARELARAGRRRLHRQPENSGWGTNFDRGAGVGMAQGASKRPRNTPSSESSLGQAISEFQAVQFKLADMATQVEAARLLVYQAGVARG